MDGSKNKHPRSKSAQVPAIFFAVAVDGLKALVELLGSIHIGEPAVRVFGGATHRRLFTSSYPDGRAGFLERCWLDGDTVKFGEFSLEGHVLLSPQFSNDL